jgi:hypothetical protein
MREPTVVLPTLAAPAPVDTHVWIRGEDLFHEEIWDGGTGPATKTDRVLEVRAAALPNAKTSPVDGTTRTVGSGQRITVEFVPKADLAPDTMYEVWLVDPSPLRNTVLAGAFRTGASRDAGPPTWQGLDGAMVYNPGWPHPKGVLVMSACGEGLSADLSGPRAKDDDGPVLYALWLAPPTGTIDYGAPPMAYVTENPNGSLVSVGQLGCPPLELALPAQASAVRIGAAAVDLAGKRSPTSELTLRLAAPRTPMP